MWPKHVYRSTTTSLESALANQLVNIGWEKSMAEKLNFNFFEICDFYRGVGAQRVAPAAK